MLRQNEFIRRRMRQSAAGVLALGLGIQSISCPAKDLDDTGKNPAAVAMMEKLRDGIVRGGSIGTDRDKKILAAYYSSYIPAIVSQVDREDHSKIVVNTVRDFKSDKFIPAVRAGAIRLLQQGLLEVVKDTNEPPSARVACLALMCEIDSDPGSLDFRSQRPPTPNADVTKLLVNEILVAPNQMEGLVAMGLAGLERHAKIAGHAWPEDFKKSAIDVVVKIAQAPKPEDRADATHSWLQRKCLDILIATPGPHDANTIKMMESWANDINVQPSVRGRIVSALSKMPLESLTPESKLRFLTGTAFLATREMSNWLTKQQQSQLNPMGMGGGGMDGYGYGGGDDGGMGLMGGRGGMGGMDGGGEGFGYGGGDGYGNTGAPKKPVPNDTQNLELRTARRFLNMRLDELHQGLTGARVKDERGASPTALLVGAEGDLKTLGDALVQSIEEIQAIVNKPELKDIKVLVTDLEKPINRLTTAAEAVPGVTDMLAKAKAVDDATQPEKTAEEKEAEAAAAAGKDAAEGAEGDAAKQPGDAAAPAGEAPAGPADGAPAAGQDPAGNVPDGPNLPGVGAP